MVTYQLTTPITVANGSISNQVTISALTITGYDWTSTPALAPLGTTELDVQLKDANSGFLEPVISYQDATVAPFWSQSIPTGVTTLEDAVHYAIFTKLVADGKLPTGTIQISTPTTGATGTSGQTGTTT
jgi:hypothetical protein